MNCTSHISYWYGPLSKLNIMKQGFQISIFLFRDLDLDPPGKWKWGGFQNELKINKISPWHNATLYKQTHSHVETPHSPFMALKIWMTLTYMHTNSLWWMPRGGAFDGLLSRVSTTVFLSWSFKRAVAASSPAAMLLILNRCMCVSTQLYPGIN